MNFKEWLINEIADVVKGPIKLYHGSSTGLNNETINRFKQQGALPIGSGHGQGDGFYAWTSEKQAKRHAIDRKKGEISMAATRSDGNPMVVILELPFIDFKQWDLDLEKHATDIVDYGYRRTLQLNKLGAKEISQKTKDYLGITHSEPANFNKLYRSDRKTLAGITGGASGTSYMAMRPSFVAGYDPSFHGGNPMNAEMLAGLYYPHQDISKGKHEKMEAWFFKRNYGKKLMALKYTGSTPLPVKDIIVFDGTNWISEKQI